MTISKEIIEVLEYLCMKFGIVIDWTSENIIPYVQTLCEKFIAWEIATSKMWLILGTVLAVIGVVLFVSDAITGWGGHFGGYFFGGILLAAGVVMIVMQCYDIITCINFPELKLYEYISTKINVSR